MIGRLCGVLLEAGGGMVLVDCGGVGYEVLVPESVMLQMPAVGDRVELRVRQVSREDDVHLYGFLQPFQRRLFDLLLSVKGCGPKIGLSLIGQLGEQAVAGAIMAQDARALSRAQGVGVRVSERIILELKDKIAAEALLRKADEMTPRRALVSLPEDDLIDALVALGYRRPEAENAAREARQEAEGLQAQIRFAVQMLSPAKPQGVSA